MLNVVTPYLAILPPPMLTQQASYVIRALLIVHHIW